MIEDSSNDPAVTHWVSTPDFKLMEVRQKGLRLMAESEVTSEQESSADDGNLFSAERNQLRVETE